MGTCNHPMSNIIHCIWCGKLVPAGYRSSWSCISCGTWVEYWITTTLTGHIEGTSYESPINFPTDSIRHLPKGTLLILKDTEL